MKRSHGLLLKLIALLALPVIVLSWAYWGDEPGVPRAGNISGHIKAVVRGDMPWHAGRSPREIIRYLERRLDGHAALQTVTLPVMRIVQRQVERPIPDQVIPKFGKGALTTPKPVAPLHTSIRVVSTPDQLREAMSDVTSGEIIELLPGSYRFQNRVMTRRAGTSDRPIIVSGRDPASVIVEFDNEEGFFVNQPHWIFQNLTIKGVCKSDGNCEHAFHVVGKARGTIIRNNLIEDFNAHIKINGVGDDWPDGGVVEYNTLTNNHSRATDRSVTPIDLVGVNRWVIADNVVSNFVKRGGDRISYGIFMKGAGRDGRVERNMVLCTIENISQPGVRVGISFGGGGTGQEYCRDKACKAEFFGGLVANNIVAHCNDFGIDVFRSGMVTIAHNTLINTAGIDVRESPAAAHLYGNLVEGLIRTRNGGKAKVEMNETTSLSDIFLDADQLNLRWRNQPGRIPSLPLVPHDFCKQIRPDGTLPGALEKELPCTSDTEN